MDKVGKDGTITVEEAKSIETTLDVVDGMRENKAAPILADMAPEKAKAVTMELAARRRLPDVKTEESR